MPKVVRKKPAPKKKMSPKPKPVKKTQTPKPVKKVAAQVQMAVYVKRMTAKLPSRKK